MKSSAIHLLSGALQFGAYPHAVVATATHNAPHTYAAASRDERPRLAGLELRRGRGRPRLCSGHRSTHTASSSTILCSSAVAASADATSVAWLLARRHVDVFVLDGGYRAYRLHLRDLLEPGPRVIGVSGRTRSGKTRALRALAASN